MWRIDSIFMRLEGEMIGDTERMLAQLQLQDVEVFAIAAHSDELI